MQMFNHSLDSLLYIARFIVSVVVSFEPLLGSCVFNFTLHFARNVKEMKINYFHVSDGRLGRLYPARIRAKFLFVALFVFHAAGDKSGEINLRQPQQILVLI